MNSDVMPAPLTVLPEAPLRLLPETLRAGELGPELEDFVVDEVPLYQPSGSGEHWYVRIQKRALTTPEMLSQVARAAGVRERDIGYAGLKDKHAVTRQWLSLPKEAANPETWQLAPGIELIEISRHTNKLRTGHLTGNIFEIRLVNVPAEALREAPAWATTLRATGLFNYFGEQRFGYRGSNLAQALAWLERGPGKNRKKARFYEKLYPSVLQAEVFNRYLTRRHALGLKRLITGDVVRLEGSGSVFVVEDAEREQARLDSGDILLTGPIFGPRACASRGAAAELEALALEALGLRDEQRARLGRAARGTRRDLLVSLDSLTLTPEADQSLKLRFELPAGSYATQLVRELTGATWLGVRGNAPNP